MKIVFVAVGKNDEPYVSSGVKDFSSRVEKYFKCEWKLLPVPKNAAAMNETDQKKKEGEIILSFLEKEDYLVALDEYGKQLDSEGLANFLQSRANESTKRLVFLIGGAFGIDASVLKRANFKWSLSQLTFPHQMVRLILAEQIYRACSIMRNEKYHHK